MKDNWWSKIKAFLVVVGITFLGIFFANARKRKKEIIREKLKNAKIKDKTVHEKHKKEVSLVSDDDVAGDLDDMLDGIKSGENEGF